jgi:hypothetical protein
MRRAAIYTFIETAKLTRSETLPLKLVDQAALVRIDLPGEFHRAGTFLQYGRPPLGGAPPPPLPVNLARFEMSIRLLFCRADRESVHMQYRYRYRMRVHSMRRRWNLPVALLHRQNLRALALRVLTAASLPLSRGSTAAFVALLHRRNPRALATAPLAALLHRRNLPALALWPRWQSTIR